MKYGVQEHFYTWQGEGVHLGKAAFFIRLYGCPVHCPWCDSAGTWHKEWPTTVKQMKASELLDAYLQATNLEETDLVKVFHENAIPFVVVTGGEPAMFDLEPLLQTFHMMGIKVHIETSGAFPLKTGDDVLDWITVSPKWNKLPLKENLIMANEIKIIVEHKTTINDWEKQIQKIVGTDIYKDPELAKSVWWLHPEWSKARDRDMSVLNSITNAVKNVDGAFRAGYRAGYQMHKLYAADLLDEHANKQLIPLGGDLERGY